MKDSLKKGLFLSAVGMLLSTGVQAQIKVEAESYVNAKSLKTDIILENEKKSVGYFDEAGEVLTYEVNIPSEGLYQISFKYLAGKPGQLRMENGDGDYAIFNTEANLGSEKWWELPMNNWPEFDFEQSALFYFKEGKQILKAVNMGTGLNIDYFLLKKTSATNKTVTEVKTTPSKIEIMPGESQSIIASAFNADGQQLAANTTWSGNAKDGVYKASSFGSDIVPVTVGDVKKNINVKVAKPTKKQEFVVSKYGKLNTKGGAVCDQSGNKISLMGPSYFWSCSAPMWWTKENVNFLVSKYNIQIIRLPVSIAPGDNTWENHDATWNEDNYLHRPDYVRGMVDEMVKAAIENDIYVIIDFHEHNAHHWNDLAKDFFTYFATKWGEYPNVMYEIYNEPTTSNSTVVEYAKDIIPVIRKIDDDNIIIVGSTQWSREPDNVTAAGQGFSNIAYTWHGYVEFGHQGDWNGKNSWNNGVPIVVTEWGLNWSKNDGGLINIYKDRKLINCFWSMSNKGGDDSKWSILKDDVFKVADWDDNDMTENGAYLLGVAKNWINFKPTILSGMQDLSLTMGSDKTFYLPENSTTLMGAADGGSGNYKYTWKQTSGPAGAEIASANAAQTKVSNLNVGTYVFELTVSDGEDELSKSVKITVYPEGYTDPGLIDDCEDNNIITRWGGSWDVFTDANKNANPHSSITEASQLAQNGVIKASIKMGNEWPGDGWMGAPYCGIEMYLTKDKTSMDLTDCQKITYKYRGTAHEFRAEMKAVDDEDYHSTKVGESTDWKTASISWSSLKQASDWGDNKMDLDKSDIVKFSWQIKNAVNSSSTLEIDDVTCVGMKGDLTAVESTIADNAEDVLLYPNPTADGTVYVAVAERSNVVVTDIAGRVLKQMVAIPEMESRIQLPTQGIYLVKVGNTVKKVVVK